MKPLLLAFALSTACVTWGSAASAHNKYELSGAVGYQFGSTRNILARGAGDDEDEGVEGDMTINGALAFTGIAGYRIQPDGFIYLSYTRAQTTFDFEQDSDGNDVIDSSGDGAIELYQFGGNIELTRGIWVPYLGASVGLAHVISFGSSRSRVFFSPVLDAGFKIDLHKHVHLRVVGRLPIFFSKGDVLCSADDACFKAENVGVYALPQLMGGVGFSF